MKNDFSILSYVNTTSPDTFDLDSDFPSIIFTNILESLVSQVSLFLVFQFQVLKQKTQYVHTNAKKTLQIYVKHFENYGVLLFTM